jgi:signal peptidase II
MSTDAIPQSPKTGSAWRCRAAWFWMALACAVSIVIDLGSKELAFARVAGQPVVVNRADVVRVSNALDPRMISQAKAGIIPEHEPVVVIPSLLDFQLVLNPGAVFGIGPGQRGFFIGFTLLALVFGLAMFAKWTGPRDHFAHSAIGLLIGGGLGNLYDRLVLGCVRDFIHPLPGLLWPWNMKVMGNPEVWPYVSNLADLFLLIGIVMLLVHLWKRDREAERASKAALPA